MSIFYSLEKTYFYIHCKYGNDFSELGFEPAKTINDGGQANYKIKIPSSENTTFKARAVAIADFVGDGIFNVWEIDQHKT